MKLVYTERAIASLQECLDFLGNEVAPAKVNEIRDRILNKADQLIENPFLGQEEPYLTHLDLSHRRLIDGYLKIIYRVDNQHVYVVDIFDTRQDPTKMSERLK